MRRIMLLTKDAPVEKLIPAEPAQINDNGFYPTYCADLVKLDADLRAIARGQLDIKLPEDTTDYDSFVYHTPKGKIIEELFKSIDNE